MNSFFFQEGTIISGDGNQIILGYGSRSWQKIPKNNNRPWFYFPDFFLKDANPWFQHEENLFIDKEIFIEKLNFVNDLRINIWNPEGESIYNEEFSSLMLDLKNGFLKKAVPYLFYSSKNLIDVQHTLRSLLEHSLNQPIFLYGFWSQEEGILGGTPELLFKIDESGVLTTAAIAGTTLTEQEETLLIDPKLLHEHQLVVEGITESLKQYGKVTVSQTEILSLPHISHAKTPIQVKLERTDFVEPIISALHPTPALGAFPKLEGSQWLEKYSLKIPRSRYGAPVGIKIDNTFYCYVAIRNVQWNRKGSRIGVGGGVVKESIQENEKEELAMKFQATRSMLNL